METNEVISEYVQNKLMGKKLIDTSCVGCQYEEQYLRGQKIVCCQFCIRAIDGRTDFYISKDAIKSTKD
jgi:hypothetical protein